MGGETMLDMLKNLNISPEQLQKLQDVMAGAKDNPMAAMAAVQEILPPEMLQQLMMTFMQNPDALSDLAAEAGVSEDQIDAVKQSMGN